MAKTILLKDFNVATIKFPLVQFLSALSLSLTFTQTSKTFSTAMTGEQEMSECVENVQDGRWKYVMTVQSHRIQKI